MLAGRHILLIIGGGIAAYKALEVIRRLKERGARVTPVLTAAGAQFVTPLSVSALAGVSVFSDLFDLTAEAEMGHIELSRAADLIVVAPATADLMAKMAAGLAGDLASTVLLATDKRVLLAPAMNVRMWLHPAVQANVERLKGFSGFHGMDIVGPDDGEMACGEFGPGRMAEPAAILAAVDRLLAGPDGRALAGRRAVVTAGPTFEPIDPVRGLTNRSSGKQGYAIAAALAARGAAVTLVSGPTGLAVPVGVTRVDVETAMQMQAATAAALPADIAVLSAAVADWRVDTVAGAKIKKAPGGPPTLGLIENPDILAGLAKPGPMRPSLVIGFAAETTDLETNARYKLSRKGCDWIVGNDVSGDVFGADGNTVLLVTRQGAEAWPRLSKVEVAARLADRIADHFASRIESR